MTDNIDFRGDGNLSLLVNPDPWSIDEQLVDTGMFMFDDVLNITEQQPPQQQPQQLLPQQHQQPLPQQQQQPQQQQHDQKHQ